MKNKTKKTITLVILCVCIIGFGYSACRLYSMVNGYAEAKETYNAIADNYVTISSHKTDTVSPAVTAYLDEPAGPEATPILIDEEVSPIDCDFSALQAVNPDVCGWLYSPGTVINYPVVQGSDNSYYLHNLFNGKRSINGSIFIDCRNAPGFKDANTILYGHNMNDGSMFSSIKRYSRAGYFEDHPFMYYSSPDAAFRIEVFAAFVVASDSEVYTFNFETGQDYARVLQYARDSSDFIANVEVQNGDHIVTLSTCTYEYSNARFVVLGKLVQIQPNQSEVQ